MCVCVCVICVPRSVLYKFCSPFLLPPVSSSFLLELHFSFYLFCVCSAGFGESCLRKIFQEMFFILRLNSETTLKQGFLWNFLLLNPCIHRGFPRSLSSKESACNAGDSSCIPRSGRSPGGRKWQSTPVFLTGESLGQRSLMGYSPGGRQKSDTT